MNLQVTGIDSDERWDEIVRSFQKYDIYYLSGYAKAFQLHGDGEPLLFYYDDGDTRAINVVMKRDIADDAHFLDKLPHGKHFDFITPYGYGGFIVEGENTSGVMQAYEGYCAANSIVCEFVRFQLFSGYEKYFNAELETRTHNVVRSLDIPLDEMMMDFEHKVRKNLKKAAAANLQIEVSNTEQALESFMKVYYSTMERTGANDGFFFTKEFFQIIDTMKNNAIYFNVFYDETIIASELVLYDNENCYSYLGGTISDYFEMRPNEFLKFEVIKWAQEKGLKNFVLGGGYGADDGIFKYKKALAPNGIVDFYIGKKIFNKEMYDKLVLMRVENGDIDTESAFFPLYRA